MLNERAVKVKRISFRHRGLAGPDDPPPTPIKIDLFQINSN